MSKLLPTDSILIYQHKQTRMYFARLKSNTMINSGTICKSPNEAIKKLAYNPTALGTSWLLVDTLTSDVYPELFL